MWVLNASAQVNQDSKYPMFISVCAVMIFMMVATLSLRAYIRIRSRRIGWDDRLTFVSSVCLSILGTLYHTDTSRFLP
jgi:hypothetical protein